MATQKDATAPPSLSGPAHFAQALENALERKNAESSTPYRQYHFAKDLGVSDSFISKVLSGVVLPGVDTLRAMEHILGLTPETLVRLADEERRQQVDARNARRQELARLALAARDTSDDEVTEANRAVRADATSSIQSPALTNDAITRQLLEQLQESQRMLQESQKLNAQLFEAFQKLTAEKSVSQSNRREKPEA